MKKKIVILGSKGMAGHMLYNYFKSVNKYDIIDVARDDEFFKPTYMLDLTDFTSLRDLFQKESPTVVINCVGILNNDAELHPDRAILINSYLPHFVAQVGNQLGFKLIHISTDCVFSGKRGGYSEDDLKDG